MFENNVTIGEISKAIMMVAQKQGHSLLWRTKGIALERIFYREGRVETRKMPGTIAWNVEATKRSKSIAWNLPIERN
jgi:hypothetical protein